MSILHQGVMRRLSLIEKSIERLFDIIPPETEIIPHKSAVDLATIHLQANIFNTWGLLDCWAHIWVEEFDVRGKNGAKIKDNQRGLGKNYRELRRNLTPPLRTYLEDRDTWIEGLSGFRHALAHSIPPYIPPYMVAPTHEHKYQVLQAQRHNTFHKVERERLDREMQKLQHFKAYLLHDLDKQKPIAFHQQTIVDFLTIEELSYNFTNEIREKRKLLARNRSKSDKLG